MPKKRRGKRKTGSMKPSKKVLREIKRIKQQRVPETKSLKKKGSPREGFFVPTIEQLNNIKRIAGSKKEREIVERVIQIIVNPRLQIDSKVKKINELVAVGEFQKTFFGYRLRAKTASMISGKRAMDMFKGWRKSNELNRVLLAIRSAMQMRETAYFATGKGAAREKFTFLKFSLTNRFPRAVELALKYIEQIAGIRPDLKVEAVNELIKVLEKESKKKNPNREKLMLYRKYLKRIRG